LIDEVLLYAREKVGMMLPGFAALLISSNI